MTTCVMLRSTHPLRRMGALAACAAAFAGCGHATPMHSVRDVQAAFASHGLRLAVVDRDRVSAILLPAAVARGWSQRRALSRPPPRASYFVVVVGDRRRLHDFDRRAREAERALGRRTFRLSRVSMRRDNVFVFYPRGAPKNIEPLRRSLDDISG